MCGICGIWGAGTSQPARVHNMIGAMRHRGPDDCGAYQDGRTALGMSRLKIIDVTQSGHQPMFNRDHTVTIVYNGEMFNFHEERRLLEEKGHVFSSSSDTEVVLRLYEEYGDDFLLRMRGMFALAIYDKRRGPGKERLLLARDHLGIKPLLYAQVGGHLIFASELKALLASGLIGSAVDPDALRVLLTFGSIYQPRTMLRDVRMLLPGHRMIVEGTDTRIERYWSLGIDRHAELRSLPYPDQVRSMSDALRESVRLHMVSDVPLGAFLSGGVDSSILVALMAREAGSRIKTFSVGFDAEGAHIDESTEARATANFLGTDHTHVLVRAGDVRDRLPEIAAALDQPSVDGVNSYFVSAAARRGVTVAISGTGGDELFAGYPWFRNMMAEQGGRGASRMDAAAAAFARLPVFDRLPAGRVRRRVWGARTRAGFLSRYSLQYSIFGTEVAEEMLSAGLARDAHAGRAAHYDLLSTDELRDGSAIERVTALCVRGYTTNQLLRDIDAVSMSHSLEVRVPYLDTVLVDMALSLPDSTKLNLDSSPARDHDTYRSNGAKRILVDVGRPLLPPDFDLQPKRGFAMPFDSWLRGPLKEVLFDTLSSGRVARRGWFDSANVERLKTRFLAGEESWARPWLLLMTELWAEHVLDGSVTA